MSPKRKEAEAWLTAFAEKSGGTIDDLLEKLADFSLGDGSAFIYKGEVVGVFEGDDPEGEKIRDDDTSYELDKRGWGSDSTHDLWKHYKSLTGVCPWDKECRGC